MNNRILVTYASRTGTTAEVAEAIGAVLALTLPASLSPADMLHSSTSRAGGLHDVDVLPMQDVRNLSEYSAVIAGSAIRAARWLPEGVQFVRTHQTALRHKPFAMFTVCITLAMSNSEQYRAAVSGWTAPVRAIVKPLSEGLFPGMLDFSRLPINWETLKLRATVAMGIFPRGDHRDWNAVHAWAEGLKPMLRMPVSV